jgi:hypothetical protein
MSAKECGVWGTETYMKKYKSVSFAYISLYGVQVYIYIALKWTACALCIVQGFPVSTFLKRAQA